MEKIVSGSKMVLKITFKLTLKVTIFYTFCTDSYVENEPPHTELNVQGYFHVSESCYSVNVLISLVCASPVSLSHVTVYMY